MAWGDLATRVQIKGAKFVGAVIDGGVVIETHDIEYVEGRLRASTDHEHEKVGTKHLGFVMAFGTIGASDPDCGVSVEARIIITGKAADGFVEIRGNGWFGYDEKGNIEGWFNEVPAMLVRAVVPHPNDDKPEMDEADWLKHLKETSPKASEAFDWAGRGRSIGRKVSVSGVTDD